MIHRAHGVALRFDGCAPVPATALTDVAGTSFKPEHLDHILADRLSRHWFEVHAENYMMAGGPHLQILERMRSDFPISLHGVGMSIGGAQPLDRVHLQRLADLVARYEPALVSEHLAWSAHGTTYYNDLLPLPYNSASLNYVCDHIYQVQAALGRPILLENPSTYVAFANSTMTETQYLREVVSRTGCGLLLDVNNVLVAATNHGFAASEYLDDFPLASVREIHLAGHSVQADDEGLPLLIDSHDCEVAPTVWRLYEGIVRRHGPEPTLIEWDSHLPNWGALRRESARAQAILDRERLSRARDHGA